MQANFCPNMEERISGAVLSSAIPSHIDELHGMDPLWPPHGAPSQLAGGDHQRCRVCH